MNNNLIIFYKDQSKDVFSFALDTDEQSALSKFGKMRPNVNKEDVVKYFYITEDKTPADTYGKYCELTENKKMKLNFRNLLIDKRVEEIRKKRDSILTGLDVPFMKSLEEDNDQVKKHIVRMKNFLRDLPDNFKFHLMETEEEIVKYNPFGNIFEVIVIDGGKDYSKPPKVTIDSPSNGFQAEAIAFIKDGKVSRIEVTEPGCGYNFVPSITIEDEKTENKCIAMCGVPQNCFLTEEQILNNTKSHYLVS
jgi:hypothetical protein